MSAEEIIDKWTSDALQDGRASGVRYAIEMAIRDQLKVIRDEIDNLDHHYEPGVTCIAKKDMLEILNKYIKEK